MKKTGMFLAVILVASLFASGLALAETSLSLTGKAIGLEASSGASVSATELFPSLSSSDIEESISNVDNVIGKKLAFPVVTTIGKGWIVNKEKRAAFVILGFSERKTSEGLTVSSGKLVIGKNSYKIGEDGVRDGKSLRFAVHGPNGVIGKLSLDFKKLIGNDMNYFEGTFSLRDGTTGDVTLVTKSHKVRKAITTENDVSGIAKKPTINSVDDSGKLGISASDGKPAETEKKGFWKRFRDFFNRK